MSNLMSNRETVTSLTITSTVIYITSKAYNVLFWISQAMCIPHLLLRINL